MDIMFEEPKLEELHVVEFPCGAFRTFRTSKGAYDAGSQMIREGTCCEKGHRECTIWFFSRKPGSGMTKLSRAREESKDGRIRLVKG